MESQGFLICISMITKDFEHFFRFFSAITLSILKFSYKAIVIKTAWYWYRDKHIDQWNRIEDPKIKPHMYRHLIFGKDAKNYNGKMKTSSINGACITGCLYVENENRSIFVTLHKVQVQVD